jgi:very-short-patch-repair endonuclease
MALPTGLITNRTANLPGDWKKQPINNAKERSGLELAFIRLWRATQKDLPEPEQEHRFHATRKWRFDFCWPDYMLAVEIEGLTRQGGRHQRSAGYRSDMQKYRAAEELGWRVLRFTGDELRTGPVQVVESVAGVLKKLISKNDNQ